MIDPAAAKDDLRGSYNQFLKSPTGADFIGKMLAYEGSLTMEAINHDEPHIQAKKLNKASGIYWVRTLLEDLSKPKSTPAKGATRSSRP